MRCQLYDFVAGQKSTSGGSSDSAANAWQANPTGSPASSAVTTVTPVQKCPRTWRNSSVSMTFGKRVAPKTYGRGLSRDPGRVVDNVAIGAIFHVEPARGLDVERDHQVI